MTQWPMVPLGEVLQLQRRWIEVDPLGTYEEIGVRCFGNGIFHKASVDGSTLGNKRVLRIEPRDLVFNNVFAWEGAVAVASGAESGKIGSHRFVTYTADEARCSVDYLRWFFKSEPGLEVLRRVSPGSAGRNRTMSLNHFPKQCVPLPPLAEQQRIVAYLDALDAKIKEARRQAEDITHDAGSLLHSAFDRIIHTTTRRRLGDVAPLVRRPAMIDPFTDYPGVSVRSFGKGTFHTAALQGGDITWEKPHLVKAGDVLMSNIKAWEGAIAVAQQRDDGRYGSHRYLTYVPLHQIITPRFLCYYLLTPEGLYHIGEASPGSADRNRTTSAQRVLDIPVPLPDYRKQLWFGELFDKLQAIAELRTASTANNDILLPAVLNDFF